MIEFREVYKEDINGVLKLYRECFNLDFNIDYYNFLNKKEDGDYFSMVAVDKGKIIAHNSIIKNNYTYGGDDIIVGVSSGGMVTSNYSGVFYPLLKKQFKQFSGDVIIAFPNQNSSPFFTELFKFDVIEQNFFNLNIKDIKKVKCVNTVSNLYRNEKFIAKRIDNHPKFTYKKVKKEDKLFVYKEYQQAIDIIYCSHFDDFFIGAIEEIASYGYTNFNIIHWDSSYMKKIGFKPAHNNIFTYKSKSIKSNFIFHPQMIDSDVF